MPELPEVETIRRQLTKYIVGSRVLGAEVRRDRCFYGNRKLGNETVKMIHRAGKYLFIEFESSKGLIIHLKMTGRLVYRKLNQNTNKPAEVDYENAIHTRVVLSLDNNQKLYYWDARTFGYIKYEDEIMQKYADQKKKLGPDPWEMREADFYKLCQRFKRPIKNLILDQSNMAGVGNIYANDGLWEAKIDPRRVSSELSKRETNELLKALRYVMERGLATGGASDNSYVDGLGNKGKYQDEFRVYKRTNEACLRCGEVIQRVVVGGRGSFVCTNCQK